MTGMADAERTVYEDLYLNGRFSDDVGDVPGTGFSCDDHTGKAELCKLGSHIGVMTRHLCACVQFKGGDTATDVHRTSEIGNDQGIHACKIGILGGKQIIVIFTVGDEGVQGQIDLCTVGMSAQNSGAESVAVKVLCIHAGVKQASAQIYGVSSALQCGVECLG